MPGWAAMAVPPRARPGLDAGRRRPRRAVGRARRLDRVRDGDRRRARRRRAIPVEAWLIDLDGGWWRLPDGHRRDGRPQAAYDDPAGARRGRAGRRRPRPSTGWPRATARPSCSSPSTARSARTARSRRCARRPGSPTRVGGRRRRRSAWTRPCSSASSAGSACRWSTGARSARRAGRATPTACSPSSRRSRRARGDARLMVKPARLGSLGRDDPRARRRGSGRGPSTPRSATTTSRSSSATSPARATSRSR